MANKPQLTTQTIFLTALKGRLSFRWITIALSLELVGPPEPMLRDKSVKVWFKFKNKNVSRFLALVNS